MTRAMFDETFVLDDILQRICSTGLEAAAEMLRFEKTPGFARYLASSGTRSHVEAAKTPEHVCGSQERRDLR